MTPLEFSTDGIGPFFAAYVKAQSQMGEVFKNAKNPAFKSNYADLASVVDAVVPAFNAAGLAVIQSPSFDGDLVTVATMIAHADGGWMRSTLSLRPSKTDPQGVGSAITYGRRYGLMAVAGVAPEDDDGNAASEGTPRGKPPRQEIEAETPLWVTAAKAAIECLNDVAACDAWWKENVAMLKTQPQSERDDVITKLKARKEALAPFPGDVKTPEPVNGGSPIGDDDIPAFN